MTWDELLNRIIDDGLAAVRADYKDKPRWWLEGAVAGLEACRGKTPEQLGRLYVRARVVEHRAMHAACDITRLTDVAHNRAWRVRTFMAEVEWVCNCISVLLQESGLEPLASHLPTARAYLKMNEILTSRTG